MDEARNMRERSGAVDFNSRLVSFLYELMRDQLTPGQVEELVRNSQEPQVEYTNGWLATYAADVATRLGYLPPGSEDPGGGGTLTRQPKA